MALLVELSGEQLDLASTEAWAVASTLSGGEARVLWRDGPALVLEAEGVSASALAGQLGLAHRVSDQAISGPAGSVGNLAVAVDLGEAGTFRVRARRAEGADEGLNAKAMEAEAGRAIAERTGARVDLEAPQAEVRLLLANKVFAGLLGGTVDRRGLDSRAVRHRPFSQPVSIHPKLARAMVNLARVRPGARIVDPFCGTGGILIEAALLGFRAAGSDLEPRMVAGSRRNLASLDLEAEVVQADVSSFRDALPGPIDAIVTDPPYGRSTSTGGESASDVLMRFHHAAAEALGSGKRLVVCLPRPEQLPGPEDGFKLESVHPIHVHRSLTRHIATLVRL